MATSIDVRSARGEKKLCSVLTVCGSAQGLSPDSSSARLTVLLQRKMAKDEAELSAAILSSAGFHYLEQSQASKYQQE